MSDSLVVSLIVGLAGLFLVALSIFLASRRTPAHLEFSFWKLGSYKGSWEGLCFVAGLVLVGFGGYAGAIKTYGDKVARLSTEIDQINRKLEVADAEKARLETDLNKIKIEWKGVLDEFKTYEVDFMLEAPVNVQFPLHHEIVVEVERPGETIRRTITAQRGLRQNQLLCSINFLKKGDRFRFFTNIGNNTYITEVLDIWYRKIAAQPRRWP